MAPIEEELQALRAQLAALTMRIYRLEQKAGIDAQPATSPPPVAPPPVPEKLARNARELAADRGSIGATRIDGGPRISPSPSKNSNDLEGTIGKLWLNRIGIIAILIGVAYFLK